MNYEILEDKIVYFTDAIENPQYLIEQIEDTDNYEDIYQSITKWHEWSACSGEHYVYGKQKNVYTENLNSLPTELKGKAEYIIDTIKNAFMQASIKYAEIVQEKDDINLFSGFAINKYMEGTMMGGHYDQQEGDQRLKYSLVMYLNDDYEGGEISFTIKGYDALSMEDRPSEDFNAERNKEKIDFGIKPKAGSIIIFPSSAPYHHTAHLIKKGSKYMVPSHWMHVK